MRISDVYTKKKLPVSFEIFPPKGDLSHETAHKVASELAHLDPDFISVTYSAAGSGNSEATTTIAHMIEQELNLPSMAHLTCINLTKQGLADHIAELKEKGITNVLALRGDKLDTSTETDFPYAKDLIEHLAQEGFCVAAAAYPEGHIECSSMKSNIEHLKEKQDAGASFFITQLFFDNEYFYRFHEAASRKGITLPISCGIMPFMSKTQIQRMVFMCGASLPSPIIKLLNRYESDPDSLVSAGIEYACQQLCDLALHGVDGLHLYTMNKPEIAQANMKAIREISYDGTGAR